MARPSLVDPRQVGWNLYTPFASPQFINASDLENDTLKKGEYITIWSKEVKADQRLFWGFGPRNRESANASFAYMELLASGGGTGTDGDEIAGKVRLAITDSTGDDIRRRVFGDLSDLADAKTDKRTERPMMAELQPAAREARFLELQVKVADSQDGVKVASDSNVKLHYGEVSV